ncbi:MAG: TIGR04255 family protein [Proteobacteria bacterium]|nr:TIGR04255 family protein [Pseudomonadota bacterium]
MKLPNAPLIEVVFELRWALAGPNELPMALRQDPVYSLLAADFSERAVSLGYSVRRDQSTNQAGPFGYSIQYRYFRDEDTAFPLLQIGPGIFAYNDATGYEWNDFRKNLREGLRTLLNSYPKSKSFAMKPVHLELRYIDVFDTDLLGHSDLEKFLDGDVDLKIRLNDFLKSDRVFSGPVKGKVEIFRDIKGEKETSFQMTIASALADESRVIHMVSKVVKKSSLIDLGDNSRTMVSRAIEWADSAHDITHAFFEDFVGGKLMKTFHGEN